MKKSRHAFTLIEVLAVVAIISILAVIGFGTYTFAMNSAKESSTKALVKRIETALENCRTKFGDYPSSTTYGTIEVTIDSNGTISEVSFGGTPLPKTADNNVLKEFLRIVDVESFKKFAKFGTDLEDAFGGKIYYKYPGNVNTTGFDLIAPGADNKFGKDATAEPKSTATRAQYYDSGSTEMLCDDIANF